jgi:hypothetical protein
MLGDLSSSGKTKVYLGGFNNVYDSQTARFQGKLGRLDEPQDLDGGRVWQVADCEVAPGMSGGPVLDLYSGVVCGVTKTRRKAETTMGGLVIPASAIRNTFPDVWKMNQAASGWADHWNALREALREIMDPLSSQLTPKERETLVEAVRQLGLGRRQFNALWEDIAGPFAFKPGRPFENVIDLAAALADLSGGELDPVIKLFEHLAVRLQTEKINSLQDYAAALAKRNKQTEALRKYRLEAQGRTVNPAGPVILIRLDAYGPNPRKKFLLTIWHYSTRNAPAKQIPCDVGPHTERGIEKIVTEVLAREIPNLPPARPLIEFALPDYLLDRAVEKWTLGGWPLGADYPVVVRFAERPRLEQHVWRSRGSQLRSDRLPPNHPELWHELWVACQDPRDIGQLNGILQRNGSLPLIAMTAWHDGKPVPRAVVAARHAGVSVILWRHYQCAVHQSPNDNNAADQCPGSRFREALVGYMSDVDIYALPEAIWQLRVGAAGKEDDSEYPGHNIAILWDDPDRFPWADAPPSRAPR